MTTETFDVLSCPDHRIEAALGTPKGHESDEFDVTCPVEDCDKLMTEVRQEDWQYLP